MKHHDIEHKHSVQNVVDHLLLIFVILTFISGKILDHAMDYPQEPSYYIWLCTHIAMVIGFTLLSLTHFKHHWGWFRTLPKNLKARKKDSLFLLLALIVLLVSGVCVTFCRTHVFGATHAIFGFLCLVVGIYHFYVRHIRSKRRARP